MRLIDADKLKEHIDKLPALPDGNFAGNHSALKALVNMQPTIKPSPNSSESPNGWIPCSERLPNDNDYRECMECLDGAVWYFTENGAMGLGYYYESTREWATTDDLRTDGEVIAWMPLPEPWKGE